MDNKIFIFVLFCAVLWTENGVKGQSGECDYKYDNYRPAAHKTINTYYYSCDLDTRKADFNEKLTKIDGVHRTGHNNDDVKSVRNYFSSKLKTFSSIFCQTFQNLEAVRLTDAEIESIDEDSLLNCKNLQHLLLFGNKIQNIPEYLLVNNPKLILFMIWNNQLTTLPENLFLNQKDLEVLKLQGNQINFLPSNVFRPLVKLELLELQDNKLQSINPEWFESLQNLERLSLDGNQISEIPSKSFASLRNLERLWIHENELEILNSDSFDGLQSLQALSLYSNNISSLPTKVFTPLKNLQQLDMQKNDLTEIHSDSFGVHQHLKTVLLNDNKINAVDEKVIKNLALSKMDMSENICSQSVIVLGIEIKSNMRNCFNNYQPRHLSTTQSCGKSMSGRGNIIGGTHINRGDFPWIAALMSQKVEFFCGGTLISNRKVISAAHCIQEKQSTKIKSPGDTIAALGVHDLDKYGEIGRIFHAVFKIVTHPDWNTLTQSFDADIAVLLLEKEVTFNEHIQPICLITPNSDEAKITTGAVVGYGKSEDKTKLHENIPKILEMPIHTNQKCFADNLNLTLISSGRTFCGGNGTGIGVCSGDSGSGLIVTNENAYFLRGVVSSSLIGGKYGCDVDAYAVFTDVLRYLDWINGIPTDRFAEDQKK